MKISEAIDAANAARRNEIPNGTLLYWLSALDGQLAQSIFDAHEGETVTYTPYTENTDPETELLVEAPWDELYPLYLKMRIDLENNDMTAYNADGQLYNAAYSAWAAWFTRTHLPKGVPALRF